MMGTGKSTVGRIVAGKLKLRFIDLDAELERRFGKSVSDYFAEEGETRFRAVEAEVALNLSSGDDVLIALGGGTVVNDTVRRSLCSRGFLATLKCDSATLVQRLAGDRTRPLLGGDEGLSQRLSIIAKDRAATYAECHAEVNGSLAPEEVATLILERISAAPLAVMLGERSYQIEIGRGAIARRPRSTSIELEVADANTSQYAGGAFELVAGEANKTIDAVTAIWDEAISRGLDRHSRFVGVGGGVVGDLTGFAASTYLRGVRFGLVATSIVAMVDSSVGGKTGFNRPGGKNLVGAFHQPDFVVCDIDMLNSLAEDEYRSGMAEVVKSLWLDGEQPVGEIESLVDALNTREPAAVERVVRRSVALKAQVVEQDEREKGQRMLLNLGHTLGHGFEAAAGFGELRHGDAVSLGMAAACDVSLALGAMPMESATRMRALLKRLRLPIDYERHVTKASLAFVERDKKRVGEMIHFVLPQQPGETRLIKLRPSELPHLLSQGAEKR
ncbi:MAG: shikimate kinase/3-dehydroquinate synthase [Polyangiales bacterium]|jgi:shikimate kinase/3-dehydroquinate synthase